MLLNIPQITENAGRKDQNHTSTADSHKTPVAIVTNLAPSGIIIVNQPLGMGRKINRSILKFKKFLHVFNNKSIFMNILTIHRIIVLKSL